MRSNRALKLTHNSLFSSRPQRCSGARPKVLCPAGGNSVIHTIIRTFRRTRHELQAHHGHVASKPPPCGTRHDVILANEREIECDVNVGIPDVVAIVNVCHGVISFLVISDF